MKTNVVSKILLLVIVATMLPVLAGEAAAQSVADIARQKTEHRATRVITDDDMPTRAPSADQPSDNAQADEQSASEQQKAGNDGDKNAPADSPRVQEARRFVAAKTVQIDAVKEQINMMQEQLRNERDDTKAADLRTSIENLQHNIQVWTSQRASAQQVVDEADKAKQDNTQSATANSHGDSSDQQ